MQAMSIKLGVKPKDIGLYMGATTKADLAAREQVKVKPVILTTYGMMAEGTNIPWLDTCIFAMPRSNVIQAAGRIRRVYENKGDPVIMDILDEDSPVFSSYGDTRLQWFKKIGCVIKDMT
jgi:superfamily II DNA or RNA helicase